MPHHTPRVLLACAAALALLSFALAGLGGTAQAQGGPTPTPTGIGGAAQTQRRPTPTPAGAPAGFVTFHLPDGPVFRVDASEAALPDNLSVALDGLASGLDEWVNPSPDGAWLLLSTERFAPDCAGWACLVLLTAALEYPEVIRVDGTALHTGGFAAVASGGALIVYADGGGPHTLDLWAVRRLSDGNWAPPLLLTAESPYEWNSQPALDAAGQRVVFDCGAEPYAAAGTALCEVGTDGANFRVAADPAAPPPGFEPGGALHHADYTPDGGLVFEASWGGTERLWRLDADPAFPVLIAGQFTNDNSPCVLADGRIASLWLGRPENDSGIHELKVMEPDGSAVIMLLTDQDILDVGLGCGG